MDKANRVTFFEETFFVANVSLEIVFGMLFFTLSGVDVDFSDWELQWRTYTTEKAFPTTRCIELVDKKKFTAAALDPEHETYIVHVASLSFTPLVSLGFTLLDVHLSRRPQIFGLITKEASTKVFAEYSDFTDVFSSDLTFELSKHTEINNYAIELVNSQQPLYRPIYSLRPVELETLKAYIETNLANGFIRLSKFLASALILFDQKSDSSLRLFVNHQGFNNFMIKNRYPLPLIGELLNRLWRARRFNQFDLTSIYHQIKICKGNK